MTTIDEIADRVEACGLALGGTSLATQAAALRRGEINILAIGEIRREADRLVAGLRALDSLVARAQNRDIPTPPDYNDNELDLFARGRSGDAIDAYLARVKGYSSGG